MTETEAIERVGAICGALPEVVEEDAWQGVRWRIRTNTFAHVLEITAGKPAAYAKALGANGGIVLTFTASGDSDGDLAALTAQGPPFFKPPWRPDVVGLLITDDTDWNEVAELLTESYRIEAPAKLAALVDRTDR